VTATIKFDRSVYDTQFTLGQLGTFVVINVWTAANRTTQCCFFEFAAPVFAWLRVNGESKKAFQNLKQKSGLTILYDSVLFTNASGDSSACLLA
jgi:hypothetical protein